MKTVFIFVLFLGFPILATANDNPILNQSCASGGEYGFDFQLNLSRDFNYSKLEVLRKNPGSNYVRDLSSFQGGNYRLDLAAHGGIEGYRITYLDAATNAPVTVETPIECVEGQKITAEFHNTETSEKKTVAEESQEDTVVKNEENLESSSEESSFEEVTQPAKKQDVAKSSESDEDFEEEFE